MVERDEKGRFVSKVEQEMEEKKEEKFNYYVWLIEHDIVGWTEQARKVNGWEFRPGDMKLEVKNPAPINAPWHYIKSTKGDCFKWMGLVFNILSSRSKIQFVPSYCMNCYKVVVRPKTLKQLFALENLQKRLNLPSKCGIEIRDYVPALYGGYFYNRGVEEGRKCYKIVREAVDKDKVLGKDVDVYLKRSCTEMEQKFGDSDKWVEPSEKQMEMEETLLSMIAYDPNGQGQPPHFVAHVHKWWIEWAFQHGDMTYLEYTAGLPIQPLAKTYHEEE